MPERVKNLSARIYERTVVQKTMPFMNKTSITDQERELIARWFAQGAPVDR